MWSSQSASKGSPALENLRTQNTGGQAHGIHVVASDRRLADTQATRVADFISAALRQRGCRAGWQEPEICFHFGAGLLVTSSARTSPATCMATLMKSPAQGRRPAHQGSTAAARTSSRSNGRAFLRVGLVPVGLQPQVRQPEPGARPTSAATPPPAARRPIHSDHPLTARDRAGETGQQRRLAACVQLGVSKHVSRREGQVTTPGS